MLDLARRRFEHLLAPDGLMMCQAFQAPVHDRKWPCKPLPRNSIMTSMSMAAQDGSFHQIQPY